MARKHLPPGPWAPMPIIIRDHTGHEVSRSEIDSYDRRGWTRHDRPGISTLVLVIPDGGDVVWAINGAPVYVTCSRCVEMSRIELMSPGVVCERDHTQVTLR